MLKLRMVKTSKVSVKLSINHPKWFLSALKRCRDLKPSHTLKLPELNVITPSGRALLELLREEANFKKISVQAIPQRPQFPVHTSLYSLEWFEGTLKPLFLERFLELHSAQMDEDFIYDYSLVFNELTQNAKDHSGSEKFLVLLTLTEIGVFDLGVGIPAKIAERYDVSDDVAAIELALEEKVTTRRLRSGGLGLYYTFSHIKNYHGTLSILSGSGQLKRYLANKKITRKKLNPRMPGTLVYCEFKGKGLK
jgi:signal transduction histidine kinase